MPKPGPVKIAIVNGDFESEKPGLFGNPEGWISVQHAGAVSYSFKLDTAEKHGGERSVRIDNVGPEPYGSIYQKIAALPFQRKTVRMSAWLRTRGVTGNALAPGAVLTLQALRSGALVAFNHSPDQAQTGDTEWTRHVIELSIPAEADGLELGAMLPGPGQVWLDDVELFVLPK